MLRNATRLSSAAAHASTSYMHSTKSRRDVSRISHHRSPAGVRGASHGLPLFRRANCQWHPGLCCWDGFLHCPCSPKKVSQTDGEYVSSIFCRSQQFAHTRLTLSLLHLAHGLMGPCFLFLLFLMSCSLSVSTSQPKTLHSPLFSLVLAPRLTGVTRHADHGPF